MADLHPREGLNHFDQVLLQHGVVQAAQVIADEDVAAELGTVGLERALVLLERAVGVRARHRFHGFQVAARVLERVFARHERVDVVDEVQHDFAEEHILQC